MGKVRASLSKFIAPERLESLLKKPLCRVVEYLKIMATLPEHAHQHQVHEALAQTIRCISNDIRSSHDRRTIAQLEQRLGHKVILYKPGRRVLHTGALWMGMGIRSPRQCHLLSSMLLISSVKNGKLHLLESIDLLKHEVVLQLEPNALRVRVFETGQCHAPCHSEFMLFASPELTDMCVEEHALVLKKWFDELSRENERCRHSKNMIDACFEVPHFVRQKVSFTITISNYDII